MLFSLYTEAQKSEVTCPRSHSPSVPDMRNRARSLGGRSLSVLCGSVILPRSAREVLMAHVLPAGEDRGGHRLQPASSLLWWGWYFSPWTGQGLLAVTSGLCNCCLVGCGRLWVNSGWRELGVGRGHLIPIGFAPILFCFFQNLFQIILGALGSSGRNRVVKHMQCCPQASPGGGIL